MGLMKQVATALLATLLLALAGVTTYLLFAT